MRTVLKIFRRDVIRLAGNPVAIVITLGVALIPSLYAWFNIVANWDPYENTSTVPVAVVNEDEGAEVAGLRPINAGDMIVGELKENGQLGWTFVGEQEALDGVRAADYYAAFVIPPDFTASLADVLDGDVHKGDIAYYVNEKANAVAPKVTDTGATTLEAQVNEGFVGTVSKTVSEKVISKATGVLGDADSSLDGALGDVRDVQTSLDRLCSLLDDADKTVAEARTSVASARQTLSDLSQSSGKVAGSLRDALDGLGQTRSDANALATRLSGALASGSDTLSGLSSQANYDIGKAAGTIGFAQGKVDSSIASSRAALAEAQQVQQQISDVRHELVDNVLPFVSDPALAARIQDVAAALDDVDGLLSKLRSDQGSRLDRAQGVSDGIKAGSSAIEGLSGSVDGAIQDGAATLSSAQSTLLTTTLPQMSGALDDFAGAGERLASSADGLAPLLSQADGVMVQLDVTLDQATGTLSSTKDSVSAAGRTLGTLAGDLSAIQSSAAFGDLERLVGTDAQSIGDFMASPVELRSQSFFPVANYGSGVAPFYTNLALWVGGFVLVAIYKLEVDREGVGEYKPWQGYFGRGTLLVCIGLLQAVICCVGDLALGVQCQSPVAFVLAGLVASFVYVNLIYALSVAFKHIGKALGVLLVVLQIPGSAGTYPIEMMPGFFRALHPWLPFTYGINAMRESIAGFYGDYYAANLVVLLVYLIPSLLIGVSARKHLLNINALFDRRLTETDLLIAERVGMDEAQFKLTTIIKALTNSEEYREAFQARVASFELRYPILVRRGFVALMVVPLALLLLLFVVEAKMAILALWIVSLVVICTFLIVVEYLHSRVRDKTGLADKSTDELYEMLGDSLRQEVFAFAPIEVMLHERDHVLGRIGHPTRNRERKGGEGDE